MKNEWVKDFLATLGFFGFLYMMYMFLVAFG